MSLSVSFVIPVWNDAARLAVALEWLEVLDPKPEVLVADASDDRVAVRQLVARFGAMYVEVEKPNRGGQLDAGARVASGDVLVFHHSDTFLSQAHYESLRGVMVGDPELVGGAFYKDIRAHHPKVGWSEPIVRLYSNYIGVLYGDQSVFVRRSHYEGMGGFRVIPLMEDVDFSKRLRRSGKVTLIDPPLRTSMRKFKAEGAVWRKVQNVTLVFLFRLGVSPDRLHRWYYRWKNAGRAAE
ncbi:MAG: glycosyltransferase involved in cell wall biosynthesis [Verrucomicrobiales bacterium]|jgi:glycosyltransferase involved in cell wall biosynthesis